MPLQLAAFRSRCSSTTPAMSARPRLQSRSRRSAVRPRPSPRRAARAARGCRPSAVRPQLDRRVRSWSAPPPRRRGRPRRAVGRARTAAAMPGSVAARRLGEHGDTQLGARGRLGEGDGERQRIAAVRAGDGESPARTSATRRAITPWTTISWNMLVVDRRQRRGQRHHDRRRLDRGDAAAVGRVAQRSADVVAEPDRAHPLARADASPPLDPPAVTSGSTGCGSARAASSRCGRAGRSRAGSCGRTGSPRRHASARRRAHRRRRWHAERGTPSWSASRPRRCSP